MKTCNVKTALAAVCCLSMATVAHARDSLMPGNCTMNETAQVSVSFNGTDKDVSVVKGKLDGKINEMKALAQDLNFTKFDVQSSNYSVNSNYSSGYGSEPQYNYSGSASFNVLPAEKATEFMVLLSKKGYQASVNVNSYNNGNCTQAISK